MNSSRLLGSVALGWCLLAPVDARDLKTFNGEVYKNITVVKKDATGLQISHDDGVIFLDFRVLGEAEQKEFGYDPDAYIAAWKQKIEDEKVRRAQAQQAAAARARAAASAKPAPAPEPQPRVYVPPVQAQTQVEFYVDAPGFRYGPYDYYGRGFSNVVPPSQGGYVIPYPYNANGPYPGGFTTYPYGYPGYYNGATWGPTIIRRR